MKSYSLYLILFVILLLSGTAVYAQQLKQPVRPSNPQSIGAMTHDNDSRWKTVDSLSDQGLPQSALKLVAEIMQEAKNKTDYPQYIKANLYELKLRAQFEEDYLKNYIIEREQLLLSGNSAGNRIKEMGFGDRDLGTAGSKGPISVASIAGIEDTAPVRQIIHSILADLYWQYYAQNRYLILDRTVLQDINTVDISMDIPMDTWDVNTFIKKVSLHYIASLKNPEILQSISLKDFDVLLLKEEGSKTFRPTLFDFLAHRAVDFFMDQEASITKPVYLYVMRDPLLLASSNIFTELSLESLDSLSFKLQALQIHQQIIKFHQNDQDPEALVDADLKRLDFVYSHINNADKDSLYFSNLISLEKQYTGKSVSASVMEKIADWYYSQPEPPVRFSKRGPQSGNTANSEESKTPNLVKAREWCLKAITAYPDTKAAQNCRIMVKSIEEPSLEFTNYSEVIPREEFPMLLKFKNVKRVWLRLVETEYLANREYYGNQKENIKKFITAVPAKSWSLDLPDAGDYQQHSAEIIMPSIDPGNYVLLVSDSEKFSESDTNLAYGFFQVSRLTYLSRSAPDGSGLIYVLDRSNGKPIKGVDVQSFTMNYDYKSRQYTRQNHHKYTTGTDGSFTIKSPGAKNNANLSFEFRFKGDTLVAENYYALYDRSIYGDSQARITTFFFTDRAIYRPGQPVYFKGIVVNNPSGNNKIVSGHHSTVTLYDVNGQKISSTEVTSGEYGSFSGSFMLPSAGLTGQMRIESESGSIYFSMEEYKRPRFEVTFKPMDSTFRLNEAIVMTGKAATYADVPLSGAVVSYRVVRSVTFPFFRYSYRIWPPFNIPDAEIANGEVTVADDGTFEINFIATPDPADFGDKDLFYTFMVYADVTDINGETQSGQTSLNVSNRALLLETDIAAEINTNNWKLFTVKSTNLQGKSVPASVKVELHKLKESKLLMPRKWDVPDTALYTREEFKAKFPLFPYMNEDGASSISVQPMVKPDNYTKEKLIYTTMLNTSTDSTILLKDIKAEPGKYILKLSAVDSYGTPVTTEKIITIFDPASKKIPAPVPLWFTLLTPEPKQGDKIHFIAGSAVNGKLLIEIQSKGKILKHEWYDISGQRAFEFDLPDSLTGQLSLLANLVYQNNNFTEFAEITIPDKSKELNFTFETFRTPLLPGGTEKWKIKITGPEGKPLQAELLASMYDASLDAFIKHNWFFQLYQPWQHNYNWELQQAFNINGSLSVPREYYGEPFQSQAYDQLNWFGYYGYNSYNGRFGDGRMAKGELRLSAQADEAVQEEAGYIDGIRVRGSAQVPESSLEMMAMTDPTAILKPEPPKQIRRNLQETAFFYPQLTTNKEGEVWVEFTVPEAITRWNFMGLAHTTGLRNAQFSKDVVTRKELTVTPNLPRFLRDGDNMILQAKISNLTTNPIQGKAKLEILDAMTMQPVDIQFKNTSNYQSFDLPVKGNANVSWQISVPADVTAVMVRITAQAGNHSDGEEVMLPILTNRMMVTETMPLPINGNETKKYNFKSLTDASGSTTQKNYRLTLEFTSNPAWYALQALPWLESREKENSDQLFNRYFANSIAGFVANSSPKIRSVFETWKNASPDALLSNLEKNQELKALMIEETPWLLEAKNESEQKQRLALMFDLNRLSSEKSAALRKLQQTQSPNGGWSWFEGMPESRYITQWIVTGMGKLHYLKVNDLNADNESKQMVQQAVNYLSTRLDEDYRRILKDASNRVNSPGTRNSGNQKNSVVKQEDIKKYLESDHLGYEHIQFLYALSYLNGVAQPSKQADEALAYFSSQARKYWNTRSLYAQGMIALWAGRSGDNKTTQSILASLREKSITNDEMGTYWRDNTGGYFWYQAPIETQALMIELFGEMGNRVNSAGGANNREVDQMKTWLLKQKQTQSWPTSTATTEAVYALLLKGTDWLQTNPAVKITAGNKTIDVAKAGDIKTEAGTGYFKTSWSGEEISPSMGNITVTKASEGPAWGAMYFQYFENLDKIKAADSPLKISRQLFVKENTASGQRLTAITAEKPLTIGDQLTVRVEITSDRNLEFVHLKDMRASSFEPTTTLSGYNWKGGLGYYQSTRDAATNFFIYYLPKGTYVFEYQLVVSQAGEYSNGISTIQCMYAPEFAAHSEGIRIVVKEK